MEIREVTPADYRAAGRITAAAYRELMPTDGDDDRSHWMTRYLDELADVADRATRTTVLIAVEGNEILGTVTLELDGRVDRTADPPAASESHVRMLAVAPAARGRGVGRRLMLASIAHAREHGRRRMTLNTTGLMTAAQRLYASLGFVRTSEEVLESGIHYYAYSLDLDAVTMPTR